MAEGFVLKVHCVLPAKKLWAFQYRSACFYAGRPAPRVTWWRDGIEIDNSDEALSERRVKNLLRLENLQRRHLNTVLTCKASNNDMVSPLTANVTLDMHCKYSLSSQIHQLFAVLLKHVTYNTAVCFLY